MGLDIHLQAENYLDIHADQAWNYYRDQHLSRTFCNFMLRQNAVAEEPELDQIGEITGIDIVSIYEMNDYPYPGVLGWIMQYADSEKEKQEAIARADAEKKTKLNGNLDKVLVTINMLLIELGKIDDLVSRFLPTERDTLSREWYFSDFASNPGDGYIGNSFGQDLRNFKRFLEFAKSKGAVTVYFICVMDEVFTSRQFA